MSRVRIIGMDLETTGFKAEDGHRITEFAFTIVDFDGKDFAFKKTINSLVNPERSIPEVVQNITGITPKMVATKKPFSHFAPTLAKLINSADLVVAHNFDFDGPFFHHEMTRCGQEFDLDVEDFCTMVNGRFATGTGKVPKLQELCWSLDVEFNPDDAHRASYDTEKMMEAFVVACKQGYFQPKCLKSY